MSDQMKPGHLHTATVDGKEAIVYLSLRCEGKDAGRRDHCYRYGPPSHDIIPKDAEVIILALVERNKAPRP
jgi:hypothetical protein